MAEENPIFSQLEEFFTAYKGMPKVILLGEAHRASSILSESFIENIEFLSEAIGNQYLLLQKLKKLDPSIQEVYYELTKETAKKRNKLVNEGTPVSNMIDYFLEDNLDTLGMTYTRSRIPYEMRVALGSCDDLYKMNIDVILASQETAVAILGIDHLIHIEFDTGIPVFRVNVIPKDEFDKADFLENQHRLIPHFIHPDAKEIGSDLIIRSIAKRQQRKNRSEPLTSEIGAGSGAPPNSSQGGSRRKRRFPKRKRHPNQKTRKH